LVKSSARLDFSALHRQASAAAEELVNQRWTAYLDLVRRWEALPENRGGSDKSWVEQACEEYRQHYRHVVPAGRVGQ
jgi:hypothetical protein